MDYILKGDPAEVAKVIRENRIRVRRGVISFTPAATVAALDTPHEDAATGGDSKAVPAGDTKDVKMGDVKGSNHANSNSKHDKNPA